MNGCTVASWSKGQSVVSLSSGEAEFCAVTVGVVEGLGMKTLLEEMNFQCNLTIYSDSSSGRAMCFRIGAGSQKHIEVRHFFVQQLFRDKRLRLEAVRGEENPADLGTKMLQAETLKVLMALAGMYVGEVCSMIGGVGLVQLNGLNAKVITLITLLLQMMSVRADLGEDEPDSWLVKFTINSVIAMAVVGLVSVVTKTSSWMTRPTRPTRRDRRVQTDAEPQAAAAGPEVPEESMRMVVTQKIYMSTKVDPRKRYHVRRECHGLRSAHNVGDFEAYRFCVAAQAD